MDQKMSTTDGCWELLGGRGHAQGCQSVLGRRLLRDRSLAVLPLESSEALPPCPHPHVSNPFAETSPTCRGAQMISISSVSFHNPNAATYSD